jgi:TolB-like protein
VPGRGREAFDRSIDMLVTRLRRKIEPVPKSPRFILSVPGEGYKFNAHPHAITATESAARPSARPSAACDLFDGRTAGRHKQRLAIAVLPFADLGGGSEWNWFADALTESLTTELSRTPGTLVVDLNPASSDCGKSADVKKLAAEVGVGYAVRGSVQLSDERMRLNVQLIDGHSGALLWAERFDGRRGDMFETLDQIVPRLARTLEIELTAAEARRATDASSSLDSTQLAFCGWDAYNRRRTPSNLRQAERFFAAALARDPENVHALTGLALAKSSHPYYFTDEECACDFAAAESAALTAAELNPDVAGVRYALSWIYTYSNRAELGLAEAERALSVNRNNAHAYAVIGMAKVFLGRPDEAEQYVLRALTLNPRDPFAYVWREFAGAAQLYLGQWNAAAAWFHRAPEAERSHPLHSFFLAAALARQGRSDDARAAVRRGLALAPRFTLRRFQEAPLGNDPGYLAQRERLCEAMREAGVP